MNSQQKKIKISSETQREEVTNAQRWACGLIDGDGHIGIEWSDAAKTKWVPVLKVSLHSYNARALYKLKKALGVGKITKSQHTVTFRVRRRSHWQNILLPLWNRFPLRTCKHYHVVCIKSAFAISDDLTLEPAIKLQRLRELSHHMRTDKTQISSVWPSANVKDFDDGVLRTCLDYDWLAGFVEAEGSFYILNNGQHGFALGQALDQHIIESFHKHFHIKAKLKRRLNYIMADTKNKKTLDHICTALHKRLLGMKSFTFAVWRRSLHKKSRAKSLEARRILQAIVSRKPS